ncbi:MAG: hypothetical protein WBB49_03825 [Microgenomates group bacterium]|jgi:hypothetical protein|nr:MAG: hypothetical protein IPH70_05020 [Candidatus Roizmanbacteria bacterium]
MSKQFYKDAFGWGSVLWLIGYILGILLFFVVSPSMIGWILTPIGTVITLWVLFKKIKSTSVQYYVMLAVVWTILAIALDYFLLVKVFNPADGYYKPDVYLYYILIFILPVVVGIKKNFKTENRRR